MYKEDLIKNLRDLNYSDKIIESFKKIKRELFIPESLQEYVYENIPLPLDDGSTISQPTTIAFMLKLLDLKEKSKVLEIGSGSGYVLALISEIIKDGEIYGVEINKSLAIKSRTLLEQKNNIHIIIGSGSEGLQSHAPYDRIIVSASFEDNSIPNLLLNQLKDQGILVCPIKNALFKIKKESGKIIEEEHKGFRFVPFKE